MEDSGFKKQIEVVEVVSEGGGGHVEVALHVKLATDEGGEGALVGEGLEALKRGKQRREEVVKEGAVGPMRRVGDGREGGLEEEDSWSACSATGRGRSGR